MRKEFQKTLEESLYVHFPLREEQAWGLEEETKKKMSQNAISLWNGSDQTVWSFEGDGEYKIENGSIFLHTWATSDHWPESEVRSYAEATGKYTTFGSYIARLNVSKLNLENGNRICFKIKPDCNGAHSTICRIGFVNAGKVPIPDPYSREGFHAMNLKNHEWNECSWEIESIAHDKIVEISFNCHRYGKEVSSGDDIRFEIKDISFDNIVPEVVYGWKSAEDTIAYSTTGYLCKGKKTAIINSKYSEYHLINSLNGERVYSGNIERIQTAQGSFAIADFSKFEEEGTFYLSCGEISTNPFEITNDIFKPTIWKLVNFIYSERCGYPVPRVHGTCHLDVLAEHNGTKLCFAGGWHDAADVSQQAVQTAEVCEGLIYAAEAVRKTDPLLFLRLTEEINWGIDFCLRTRFGDGYRAEHCAIRRWTDLKQGTMDDEEVDVDNRSFENFMFAAVEALAAKFFAVLDPELSWKLEEASEEDFSFAEERLKAYGLEPFMVAQHSSSASISQYYAVAALASARIFQNTKKEIFQLKAEQYADKLLYCQEQDTKQIFYGYFYRDEKKDCIVHFTHQARDQIFVHALCAVCDSFSDALKKERWEKALHLHGEYLKKLFSYASPYGMMPAGIYHESEIERQEDFERIHPHVVYEQEKENFREQLENGIKIGNGYYIKMMPVWFSFRGNNAILLSQGLAAAELGKKLKDQKLIDIASEQLYWTLGKNPFRQSLIYGEGRRYGRNYTALLKETIGEIAVGVQTRGNEDIPYWPDACVATYREVWLTPCGKWLMLAGILMDNRN